ncbi:MAG: 50S ribosomal protein L11 methyltransferase [Opitutaceae bacterium]|jgi:ribosomal protein L11 methyltransferase|nr:50S ribosomal protein L11 methyltransferase [Opitutaceae bacterium]
MSLFEIKTGIAPENAGLVGELLVELGVPNWSVTEDVVARKAWLSGVFEDAFEAQEEWMDLLPLLDELRVGTTERRIPARRLEEEEWRDSYKRHFHASRFGRLHWIPEWERGTAALPEGDVAVWLDPGLAFGTGNHETTRLCCERLVAAAERLGDKKAEAHVVDAGCGSGILALSAARLGFAQIAAFDNDPEAVRVSKENAELNGLSGAVGFFGDDLAGGVRDRRGAVDLLLANIQADVLLRFSDELLRAMAPGGELVLSGILAEEVERVGKVFRDKAPGWNAESRTLGDWADLVLRRPA